MVPKEDVYSENDCSAAFLTIVTIAYMDTKEGTSRNGVFRDK